MTPHLTFHGVGRPGRPLEAGEAAVWVDADRFAALLDEVAEHHPEAVVTFDDGNASDHDVALPALRERGLTATFFVLAGRLDTAGSLSSDQVRALVAEGMVVGSHGLSHRDWRTLDDAGLDEELVRARDVLEDVLGRPVRQAACPFGSYDRRVLARLRGAGYERVFTSDGGHAPDGRWLTPRATVHAGDDVAWLRAALAPPGALATVRAGAKRWAKGLR
ncbi:MAG: polysaccharide deacetylase family protein [Acidimicrobiia bacterium]